MNPRLPVFLAHAPSDQRLARELAAFLELGCDVQCEAVGTSPREDLIELAEQCTGHLVLLLSKDSWPTQIPRERWEPVLKDRPLACVLVNPCPLPGLLRRGPFFEVEGGNAGRGLKRWLWGRGEFRWSPDLEELYAALADRSGVRACDPETARRFAREAEGDFEAVLWVPCHDRSLAEALGEPEKRVRAAVVAALPAAWLVQALAYEGILRAAEPVSRHEFAGCQERSLRGWLRAVAPGAG